MHPGAMHSEHARMTNTRNLARFSDEALVRWRGVCRRNGGSRTQQLERHLALQHRIMTKYTSFVAVEERQIVNPDGTYETVVQPVDLPPAVDARTALGPQSAAKSTLHARFANPSPKQRSHGTGRGGGGVAEGTIGLGNVGIIGKGGGSGAGAGYGRGAGEAHGGRVPRVRAQKPEVAGAIDKDIIRRIVRAHIAEVRKCYEAELAKDPSLEVKLAISFVIDPTGAVREVKLDHRDAALPSFEQCLTAAFRRWRFPKPEGGGVVTVSYPFHFQPE